MDEQETQVRQGAVSKMLESDVAVDLQVSAPEKTVDCNTNALPLLVSEQTVKLSASADNLQQLPTPLLVSRESVEPAMPAAGKRSLFDNSGRPLCKDSSLYSLSGKGRLWLLVVAVLYFVNSYYFGSGTMSEYVYAQWWQKIKFLYDLDTCSLLQQGQFLLCMLTAGILLVRLEFIAVAYGRHRGVWVALLPCLILGLLPLTIVLNAAVQHVASSLAFVTALLAGEPLGNPVERWS